MSKKQKESFKQGLLTHYGTSQTPIRVGNPRMIAFLKAGGSLVESEKWPDTYTNMHFMIWIRQKWHQWRTLHGLYVKTPYGSEPTILSDEQTAEFDRWLQLETEEIF